MIRARMLGAFALLARHRENPPRAIARALRSTALERVPAQEREWIDHIEERRALLASRQVETRADFAPAAGGLPDWATAFDRPIPMWGATALLSIPPIWGLLLLRLVRELAPRSCVELGTAFGISTAYQGAALELNGAGRMLTLDAAREWSAIAAQNLAALGLDGRVEQRIGQIGDTLADVLEEAAPVDYVFIDAEHQREPTVRYFEALLPHAGSGAVIVFDDIGFPKQMRTAWKAIAGHDRTAVAIGLGRMGLVSLA